MTNRNSIVQWFITFPQTACAKQDFLDTFPPHTMAVVAQETHVDGGLHLHLLIVLKKGLTKSKLLHLISSNWPNDYKRIDVQVVKNKSDVIDYLYKEDPTPLYVDNKERKKLTKIQQDAIDACDKRDAERYAKLLDYGRITDDDRIARWKRAEKEILEYNGNPHFWDIVEYYENMSW